MEQGIITPKDGYRDFDKWLVEVECKKAFLVCDASIQFQKGFNDHIKGVEPQIVEFSGFRPNPLYESVQVGVRLFRREGCDTIIAVGGGSAIDVAKCVKAYATMEGDGEGGAWLDQPIEDNGIPFLAMPTTAGTGSEATRYAVIYHGGKKQSVTSESFIPDAVLMDPDVLITLPVYQKKATMCDALCHAVESFWSVNSTEESKGYSREAIGLILASIEGYLANENEARANMLLAANVAGKAINITQTTAGHAMCYKLTSLFGCAHGHAAILCDRVLYPWMIEHVDACVDSRGEGYLRATLDEIGRALGCEDAHSGAEKLNEVFECLELTVPAVSAAQFEELKASVNPVRLKNHPIALDEDDIDSLYHQILNGVES